MRLIMVLLVVISLITGISGGLLRAGASLPALSQQPWAHHAVALHAALMVCGFLGTVISIERAVALRLVWAFVAPWACAVGALCLLNGQPEWGAWAFELGALVFLVVNVLIVARQAAPHTWLLLASALAWVWGNTLFLQRGLVDATLSAWFSFLVLTIAAERLEMSRLLRRKPYVQPVLIGIVTLLLLAMGLAAWQPMIGGALFGVSLLLLAVWFGLFDIARHTVRTKGLSRYMAICLLTGYAWLAVAGLCWAAYACGWSYRDASLHALGLGFIMSMVMGHAPVILPAVAGIKLHFDRRFYVPLVALHLSLFVRLIGGSMDPVWRTVGSELNAAALGLFAMTVISAALSWRRVDKARARIGP